MRFRNEAIREEHGKVRERFGPSWCWAPALVDVTQGQVEQFGRGLVIREVPAGLDDLPELHVETLDRVVVVRMRRIAGGYAKFGVPYSQWRRQSGAIVG